MAYLFIHLNGLYVLDEDGTLLEYKPMEFSEEEAYKLKKGILPESLKGEIDKLKSKYELKILGRAYKGLDLPLDLNTKLINKSSILCERK